MRNNEPPSLSEIKSGLKRAKDGRAPGKDNICAEILEADIDCTTRICFPLFKSICIEEQIPTDWKSGIILTCPKKDIE
jgi:hypothetical protein